MKRIIFIAITLFFALALYAQKDTTFYRHEVKMSLGDALLAQTLWTYNAWGDLNERKNNANLYANLSFSYFYRPVKWLWIGGNFVNYIGSRIYYDWREYYPNGKFQDFSKSKIKYCAAIAPEIRFSFLNKKSVILYGALSGGIGFENGFSTNRYKYPEINYYFHITYFGFSCNLGENKNIFLGGEVGGGFKGLFIFHGGYRF